MLLKELSKSSRIYAKDLLSTPVGVMCYMVDGLKAGSSEIELREKLKRHQQTLGLLIIDPDLVVVNLNYRSIHMVKDVFELC